MSFTYSVDQPSVGILNKKNKFAIGSKKVKKIAMALIMIVQIAIGIK